MAARPHPSSLAHGRSRQTGRSTLACAAVVLILGLAAEAGAVHITGALSTWSPTPSADGSFFEWGPRVANRQLTWSTSWFGATYPGGPCVSYSGSGTFSSDASGNFDTGTLPSSAIPATRMYPCRAGITTIPPFWAVTMIPWGSEAWGLWDSGYRYGSYYDIPATYTVSPARVPEAYSQDGTFWARRFGTGSKPIFFIEGFDPGDTVKTERRSCPSGSVPSSDTSSPASVMRCDGILELLRATIIGYKTVSGVQKPVSFFDFATGPNYSLWILANGNSSLGGLRGDDRVLTNTAGQQVLIPNFQGQTYQAMKLIRDIVKNQVPAYQGGKNFGHYNQPLVVAGFSMGGLLAKVGLEKWCGGAWRTNWAASGYAALGPQFGLEQDCPNVRLWAAADAPLGGANVPPALARYICDQNVMSGGHCWKVGNNAAAEMVWNWVNTGTFYNAPGNLPTVVCNTNCVDQDGCASSESSFTQWCGQGSWHGTAFWNWVGANLPKPKRAGVLIPSVVSSHGDWPFWDRGEWRNPGDTFMQTHIHNIFIGDHWLELNTAGMADDMGAGSSMNNLLSLNGLSGTVDTGNWLIGTVDYDIRITSSRLPTFIRSKSSLEYEPYYNTSTMTDPYNQGWNNGMNMHSDYAWSGIYTQPHLGPLPTGAASMIAAWVDEMMVGKKTAPLCYHPYKQRGMKDADASINLATIAPAANCRQPSSEIGGQPGVDDDGDGIIDDDPRYGASCGDGFCDKDELEYCLCPQDCPAYPPTCKVFTNVCGDGICSPGETASSCCADCGTNCPILIDPGPPSSR